MLKNIIKILAFFIIGMIGGIFADQIIWPYFIERPFFLEYGLDKRPIHLTETKEIIIQENIAMENMIEEVKQTVVGIRTKNKLGKILEGSGLIITSDGYMITLAELVPDDVTVSFFSPYYSLNKIDAKILKRDIKNNLALIKIEKSDLNVSAFVNLEKLKLGRTIFLIGTIFEQKKVRGSILITTNNFVNQGIISYLNKDIIKTNIYEQNSILGAPLFDIEGSVLGLNTVDSNGKASIIPITIIQEFIGF